LSENTRRLYLRCARDFAAYCAFVDNALYLLLEDSRRRSVER